MSNGHFIIEVSPKHEPIYLYGPFKKASEAEEWASKMIPIPNMYLPMEATDPPDNIEGGMDAFKAKLPWFNEEEKKA